LSDPSRLAELRDFYVKAEAVARIDGTGLVVRLPGQPGIHDEMLLRAYLHTWLAFAKARGGPVSAELSHE
jgi:hypothetical protein